ncbi:MAG: ribosome maturation factor RimP [Alphaproteobacteria bacterium]|nr:ribosome maturation factor RimP [Alphaproteobacteria bacterium]NDC56251.1 ribosome maturation factor RimP [Alphaproteobacteria bacterium]NDG04482.1 ribosome maturation factor RimP [Alphaproteobacteria bacterium]
MIGADTTSQRIATLACPVAEGMGLQLVRVQMQGGKGSPVVQIMIERGTESPTIDDCANLSRALGPALDETDIFTGAYRLEVSSPGIDRPLTRPDDFNRFNGYEARIETAIAHDGQRNFTGRLLGLEGKNVHLRTDKGEVALPLAHIARAKLVLTDDLIKATQKQKV